MRLNFIFDKLKKRQTAQPHHQNFEMLLQNHVPTAALPLLLHTLQNHIPTLTLKITPPRRTKLGDYRPACRHHTNHQITINNDLNPYSFLITLLHEVAHLHTYTQHSTRTRRIEPHGTHWQNNFKMILQPYLTHQIFAPNILDALHTHLHSIKASSCTDLNLMRALEQHNTPKIHTISIENLICGTAFTCNGKIFIKNQRRRTRYLCTEQSTNKSFTFHALMQVTPVL
jgi:predicted SprT family Zn-dependent metalloprotease